MSQQTVKSVENANVAAASQLPVSPVNKSATKKRKIMPEGMPTKTSIIESLTVMITENGKQFRLCAIDGTCPAQYMQDIFRSNNFERHFRFCHPEAFELSELSLFDEPSSKKPALDTSSKKQDPAVVVRTTKQRLIGGVLKLVTINGLPFAAMDWDGFKDILNPMLEAFKMEPINRKNVKTYIKKAADGIDVIITRELRNTPIALKLDIVSKQYRSMLGVNCQYVNNRGKVVKRTLGIIELQDRHTGQNLKEELSKLLKIFEIELWQITSITIDNASNMVKMVRLLSDDLQEQSSKEETVEDSGDPTVNADDSLDSLIGLDWVILDEDEDEEADEDEDDLLDSESYETAKVEEWVKVLEQSTPAQFIPAVRCGAHTTQLVVHDVCRTGPHKETLRDLRKKAKKFRTSEYKTYFDVRKQSYPPLPNETRWNSDFKLISSIHNGQNFYHQLGKQYPELDISKQFDFIKQYVEAFEPISKCTVAAQKLELTLSDFFAEWLRTYGKITELPDSNMFKMQILIAMDNRQSKLFGNVTFKAALYFDPRFVFNGSNLLRSDQVDDVIESYQYA